MGRSAADDEISLNEAIDSVGSSKQKVRIEGVKRLLTTNRVAIQEANFLLELSAIFDRSQGASNIGVLTDKAYHLILEATFKATLSEKKSYLAAAKTTKATALNRLVACADATRRVVRAGAGKLKSKTVQATVEHIIQTLQMANGTFFEPITQHYLKILSTIFGYRVFVEHMKPNLWEDLIDFCLRGINQFLDDQESETSGLSRSFSGLGSGSIASTPHNGKESGMISRQNVEEFFQILVSLVSATNAPLISKYGVLSESTLRFLHLPASSAGQVHQIAFSIINTILLFVRTDYTSFSISLAQKALPDIARFWQGRSVARDETLNSVRDEMLILLIHVHLHLERLVQRPESSEIIPLLETLADVLRADYAKRSTRDQLQLDDLEMIDLGIGAVSSHPFELQNFRLNARAARGERNWAHLQMIGIFERLIRIGRHSDKLNGVVGNATEQEHPRKRQKTARSDDRLLHCLTRGDEDFKLAEMHILPFVLHDNELEVDELSALLQQLLIYANDKRPGVASWALLAISSCAYQKNASQLEIWSQLWQRGCRAVASSTTCRAASVQLHSMLAHNLVPLHEIGEDINAMVTSTDTHGPIMLWDSSINLMTHLLHTRVIEVPGSSLDASKHVIRWLFRKWTPDDKIFASHQSQHVTPLIFTTLLRVCLGLHRNSTSETNLPCGAVAQAWQNHLNTKSMMSYLLLLPEVDSRRATPSCSFCPVSSSSATGSNLAEKSHFKLVLKLVGELLPAKFLSLASNWKSYLTDRSTPMTSDIFRSGVQGCVTALIALQLFPKPFNLQMQEFSSSIEEFYREITTYVTESDSKGQKEAQALFEVLLLELQPFVPACTEDGIQNMLKGDPPILAFLLIVSEECVRQSTAITAQSSDEKNDLMDIAEDQSTQNSTQTAEAKKTVFPRHELGLALDTSTFYGGVAGRVIILSQMHATKMPEASVPSSFFDYLLGLSDENLISSRVVIMEVLNSELMIDGADATRFLTQLATLLSSTSFSRCEVMMAFCLEILVSLGPTWLNESAIEEGSIGEVASELYDYFIGTAVERNVATQEVQKRIVDLLLFLMRTEPEYGVGKLPSAKASLFRILNTGSISVRFYVAESLPGIFNYFLMETHDQLFLDILDILPNHFDWREGMAFRMFMLAKLASTWSNLLRRCIYHIFEIPGKLDDAIEHATRCLQEVAKALKLKEARDILDLFAPQLLFTWIENEEISNLPYKVFGFSSLRSFVANVQDELTGLVNMRGEENKVQEIAEILGISQTELLQQSFTRVMAYSISQDARMSKSSGVKSTVHELRIQKRLGQELFLQMVNQNFVEIIALIFSIVDQESDAEKYFKRRKDLAYASDTLTKIKNLGSSSNALPPNQQPMFSSKTFPIQVQLLCSTTEHNPSTLYTPTLVVYMCRKLLNTVHPALGSLHACSVLRKLRLLVSIAGDTAVSGYPLEVLLQSLCTFLADVECSDDAIGLAKFLLTSGSRYLLSHPQFVAGIGLSYLGTLRLFLQTNQSSTTQESQFKNTMSAAQTFAGWLKKYLREYDSPALQDQSKKKFESLLRAAYEVDSGGNADIGSSESSLLHQLLRDGEEEETLLNQSSRNRAISMLSSDFNLPVSFRKDFLGKDDISIAHAAIVWKSCFGQAVSDQYLSWAARVLGRAFAASGQIPTGLVQESDVATFAEAGDDVPVKFRSRVNIVRILEELTFEPDDKIAGLSESALRSILSNTDASSSGLQKTFSPQLYVASIWNPYKVPPSDTYNNWSKDLLKDDLLSADAISRKQWLQDLCVELSRSAQDDYLLLALIPLLGNVPGFAERVFPFILHLALTAPFENPQLSRKLLSKAFVTWLAAREAVESSRLRTLINAILYLRTQAVPQEKSLADRSRWLDIDYFVAAQAATLCGMHKTALLFVEEFVSSPAKASRRSSISIENVEVPNEILLTIFQSIDDPDMYYGVEQTATLDSILAKFEYEKDGSRSLAFRGAQYDSHVRHENGKSREDLFSLVKALDVLNQSGLSHALLQGQQTTKMTSESLDSMFRTARKLEQWDLPVPPSHDSNAVTVYKAFQMVNTAGDRSRITMALNEGLEKTMRSLVKGNIGANALHESLQTLASLTEMDEITSSRSSDEFEELLMRFQQRAEWMKTGRFDDIAPILSTRGTVLSTLSQRVKLQEIMNVPLLDTRVVEVKASLLSSRLHRAHSALQESLSLATSMIELVKPCSALGIEAGVSIRVEAANTLWDQGEMASSIRMLQTLDDSKILREQTIIVERSTLLSQIGYQVSTARLERADRVIENYLKPALKDLNGKTQGSEAGQVFHQFAVFCDEQLHDPDTLEDLERLRKLKMDKEAEVEELNKLMKAASSSSDKARYKSYQRKAAMWQKIDADEYQRQKASQEVFLRQCLENYLLALTASDDHNKSALRFTALWLEHSEHLPSNDAVAKHIDRVPSRKFAPLMNQLTSRLQDSTTPFQKLLYELVKTICQDHPYHGLYQIYASAKNRPEAKDEAAVSRQKIADRLSKELKILSKDYLWQRIYDTNGRYCYLAAEKDDSYRSGRKYQLTQSKGAYNLNKVIQTHMIPPPTMHIPLASDLDYSRVPKMIRLDNTFSIASGVSAPKILTVHADNGQRYKQLVKGGNDDLRQDAIMEQVFEQVSDLLQTNRSTRQRNLSIRTYKVLPLTSTAGVIEFVADTVPLHEFLMPAHEKYFPKDLKPNQCRKEIADAQPKSVEQRIARFRSVAEKFHPVMRYFFTENFPDPDQWFASRLAYTRSTAAISILGHVLGLGDRHGHNILLDNKSGEVVHIDLGVAFEMGRVLPVPELVPFRLTRDIVDGMGITKTEGVFRRCCEFTLEALRKEIYSIMTILDVLRYDPLYSWSISPVRLEKLQKEQSAAPDVNLGKPTDRTTSVNEPGEADRALTVVNKKLSKTLSVSATVNDLINQASDEKNLAVLYCGWAAYA